MPPWVALKGDKKKIKRVRQIAERLGLEVRLYTEEEKVDVTYTIPSKSKKLESILKLPPRLIKTYTALKRLKETENLKEAQADNVAEITKRARAYESSLLNQLHEQGYIGKRKEAQKAYFWIID